MKNLNGKVVVGNRKVTHQTLARDFIFSRLTFPPQMQGVTENGKG